MANNLFSPFFARFNLIAVLQRISLLRVLSQRQRFLLMPGVFLFAFFLVVPLSLYAAPAKTDMRVVIDISGSMKKTDPNNLRVPAVKLMLNLAKDGDRFGVWTFGQYVNMLVPHKDVTAEWRKDALKQTDLINSVALYTNIGLALEKASLNQTESDPGWDKTIVLLSDGKVDISKNNAESEKEKQRILSQVVPSLRRAGFKIHSVALSENADLEFLRTLGVDTGGSFSIARNADELLGIFVEASDKANSPEQVPLVGNEFDIDKTVNEFTALIFRKPGSPVTKLVDPRGKKYSHKRPGRNINWFNDKRYDLITVQAPRSGSWRLEADVGKGNRVTVVSDLNLVVKGLPDNVIEGERVTMRMYLSEQGKAITKPDFLKLMDITFSQRTSAGELFEGALSKNKKGQPILPKDGVYSAKLGRTLTDGKHEFSILVDGKTFRRKRTHQMMVHTDVLDVDVASSVDGTEIQSEHFLTITPKISLIDTNKLEILAQIQAPDGEKQVSTAVKGEGEVWTLGVPAFGGLGMYQVLVKVNGISVNGKPFELVQGPYRIDHSDTGLTGEVNFADDELTDEMLDVDLSIDEVDEQMPLEEDIPVPEIIEEPLAAPETEPEEVMPVVEAPVVAEESSSDAPEEDLNILMLGGAFMLANLFLLGGGFFLYRKMANTQDANELDKEQTIMRAQQARAEAKGAPAPAAAQPAFAAEDAEEQTVMRSSNDMASTEELTVTQIQPQKPVAAPEVAEPQPTEEEDNAYVNTADPMELDDDEFIEIDDEFDELDEEMDDALDGLDELDVMLSEQEEGGAEGSGSENDKKDPFVNDEFQLDSPEQ